MPWHGPAGAQLYYVDSGRGDTVLLMPGWGGSIAEFGAPTAPRGPGS